MRTVVKFLFFSFLVLCFFSGTVYSFDLKDFFSQVEKRDYQLKNLLHREKAGKYRVYQAESSYLPHLDFTSSFGWEKYQPYYGGTQKNSYKYYYFSLRQPIFHLDLFAQIKESKLSNEIDALRTAQQRCYARYYALTTLVHYSVNLFRKKVLSELVKVESERLREAKKLLTKRIISYDTYLDIEKDYQDAVLTFHQVERDLDTFKFILKELVGNFTLPSSLCIPSNLTNFASSILPHLSALKKRLKNNFEVKIAQKNIEVASAEYQVRKYQRLPKVDFNLSYSYTTSSVASSVARDFRAELYIQFPIFQGGYLFSRQAEALELKEAAWATWRDTYRRVQFEFEQSYNRFQRALKNFSVLKNRLSADKELLSLYEKAYLSRAKSIFDLLKQKAEVLKDKDALLQRVDLLLTSYVEVYYLAAELEAKNLSLLYLVWQPYCYAEKTSSRIRKKGSH